MRRTSPCNICIPTSRFVAQFANYYCPAAFNICVSVLLGILTPLSQRSKHQLNIDMNWIISQSISLKKYNATNNSIISHTLHHVQYTQADQPLARHLPLKPTYAPSTGRCNNIYAIDQKPYLMLMRLRSSNSALTTNLHGRS